MNLRETDLAGCWVIEPERHGDERGFFARVFDREVMAARGLEPRVEQSSLSFTRRRGTVRGMHFQSAPHEEAKMVRVVRGAIHDVAVDVRPGSATFGRHVAVELTAENRLALFVPAGFAHGFQTLVDDSEIYYQISAAYSPEHARGFHHADPEAGIAWPLPVALLSARDAALPSLAEATAAAGTAAARRGG